MLHPLTHTDRPQTAVQWWGCEGVEGGGGNGEGGRENHDIYTYVYIHVFIE